MNEQEKQKIIKAAIEELGIDKPIMSTRVVGTRLELYLYGGSIVIHDGRGVIDPSDHPFAPARQEPGPQLGSLTSMSKPELLKLAKEHNIPGRSKMTKLQLTLAIQEATT